MQPFQFQAPNFVQKAIPMSPLGAKAKNPVQNVKAPTSTLTPAQQQQKAGEGFAAHKALTAAGAPTWSSGKAPSVNPVKPPAPSGSFGAPQNAPIPGSVTGQEAQNQLRNLTGGTYGVSGMQQSIPTPSAPTASTAAPSPYQPSRGLYGQLISGLANSPQSNTDVVQARQNVQQLQNNYADRLSALQRSGVDMSLATGEEGVLARTFAAKEAAAQSALQNALQSQQLQQQALGTAAGLAAPQQYGITTSPFDPITGQFGSMPGGQGGAFGAGQITGNVALGQQFQQTMLPAYEAAGSIKQGLDSWLDSNPTINPTDVNLINNLKGWVLGQQFSDPRYPQMSQFLNEFLNTLTPIIGSPGEVTNYKQSIVNSLLNPSSGTSSLKQQADSLYRIAGDKIRSVYQSGTQSFDPSTVQGIGDGGNTFGSFFGQ
jgi:hypothetical protein